MAFFVTLWEKFKGWLFGAAALLLAIWYVFSRGEKKAKAEAEVKDLKEKVVVAETVTKAIQDDIKLVNETKKEVDALPDPAVADRARKWVRNKT